MRTFIRISLAVLTVLTMPLVHAQNYKAPMIDASGKITGKDGTYMGTVTAEGIITDAAGIRIAHVDPTGTLIDDKTGKKLGKAEKNGNFLPYYTKTKDEGWSTSAPMNGTCLVKDNDGHVKGEVHENYKAFGACAIHCLSHHMDHTKVRDNSQSSTATYVCPMHADVTSDKPGKCSRCGMEMVKKPG